MGELSIRSGPLTVLYQNGFLRYFMHGDNEILRMIYFAFRDENWGTHPRIMENEQLNIHDDHFDIHYDCFHELNGKRVYHWKVDITGNTKGRIEFQILGTALEDLQRNRAGFCILHPTAGQWCETHQVDDQKEKHNFPQLVSASNPFKDLKGLRWKSFDTMWALQFEGDTFETEDQRNWTDASFKTFCTPLSKPFPVLLKKGDTVSQKVVFFPESILSYRTASTAAVRITERAQKADFPKVGIGRSTVTTAIDEKAIQALRALSLNHYRIEVNPIEKDWRQRLLIDCENASKLDLPLEIALFAGTDFATAIDQFVIELKKIEVPIRKIFLVNDGLPPEMILYAGIIKTTRPDVQLGGGTDFNFAEFNKNIFDATGLDYVGFSIQPQEHAFDNATLIENLAGQFDVVFSARKLYPGKPIHVSPLTFKKRSNPYASNPEGRILSALQRSDSRQKNQFGAAFTLGGIKSLAQAMAKEVTLFETVGSQGILSEEGDPFPIYHVLKEILEPGYDIVVTESSHPLIADALVMESRQGRKLLLVNYTDKNQRVLFNELMIELEPYETRGVKSEK